METFGTISIKNEGAELKSGFIPIKDAKNYS